MPFVQDARKAAFFVVAARDAKGVGLYAVAADAPGRDDPSRPRRRPDARPGDARCSTTSASTRPASSPPAAPVKTAVAAALPAILTIVAADLCGAAEWQLQTTAEYARVRTQFDHLIGFFQAVKHPIVNVMIDVDRARSLTYAAACAIDTEPAEALRARAHGQGRRVGRGSRSRRAARSSSTAASASRGSATCTST